ncbi:MAG: MFS transporter [Verrucomicrobiae bacterium]|nr:MFS transporter [Verrucomicrobiae bacterium]
MSRAVSSPVLSASHGIFRALRHSNFRLFYAGQGVSLIGTWMQQIAQSWLVYDLTHSPFWLGMIGFIGALPILMFSLFGGVVADRFPKRRLVLGFQSVLMVLALILGLLTGYHVVQVWHVAVIAFLSGLVNAFEMPARQSFIVDMVGKEDLGNAIALNSALFNSARLIGPAIAGILIATVGTSTCFFVNSASFLAVIISLLVMKVPHAASPRKHASVLQSTIEGLRYARHTPAVFALLILVSIITIFGWSYSVLMPIFADQILHGGPRGLGILVSFNGVGALTAALTLAAVTDKVRPRRMAFTGIGVFCIGVTALALSEIFWLSAAMMVLVGFGLVTFFATSNTSLQRRVSDHMRGRIMGIYSFSFAGLFPIGSLMSGFLAHKVSAPFAVIFGACMCGATAIVVAQLVPPVDEPAGHASPSADSPPPA